MRSHAFGRISHVALAVLLLAGLSCGTGSSGFGPRVVAERDAIEQSLRTGECVQAPGDIEVCATTTPDEDGVSCDVGSPGCVFDLVASLPSVPAGTELLAVARPQDLSGPWRSATGAMVYDGEESRFHFETGVERGTVLMVGMVMYASTEAVPAIPAGGLEAQLLEAFAGSRVLVYTDWPTR